MQVSIGAVPVRGRPLGLFAFAVRVPNNFGCESAVESREPIRDLAANFQREYKRATGWPAVETKPSYFLLG